MDNEKAQQLPKIAFIALYVVSGLFEAKKGDDDNFFLIGIDHRFPALIEFVF